MNFQMEIVARNAGDALAVVFAARRFDDQNKVLLGVTADDAEKSGELRLAGSSGSCPA